MSSSFLRAIKICDAATKINNVLEKTEKSKHDPRNTNRRHDIV